MLHQIKAHKFILIRVTKDSVNGKIQGLVKAFEYFSSTFQGKFNFQGLFKTVLYIQVLFKAVRTLLLGFSCQSSFLKKSFRNKITEWQTVWTQIRSNSLLGLIWVKTVFKCYQQIILAGMELEKQFMPVISRQN